MSAAEKESEINKLRSELMRLQTELTSLKTKPAAKTTFDANVVQPNLNNNLAANQINGTNNNISNQTAGSSPGNNPSRELNRAPAMIAPSATDPAAPSINSSAASAIGAGGSTQTAPTTGGLILLKLDGLNADVASTEIVSLINKNGNSEAPIYVEEGGYVKEIVPIIKDGRLVLDGNGRAMFEKINKGKIGEFFAKNKVKANTVNPSNADLKRAEQAKVKAEEDRVKYNALKALSDKALK
jgi:hypothetical protein